MNILKIVGLPAVIVIAAGFVVSHAAGAIGYGGIGGRVANPDPTNPRSQSIFIYSLERGESKTDQLLVMNNTDETKTIALGSVDGVVTNDGAYTCRQESEPVSGSGGWVELAEDSVTLPAGESQEVDFTVTVPRNADVGEHNSCLTMQVEEEPSTVSSGVRLHMRQAIRMAVTIPGELHRSISITGFEVHTPAGGGQRYTMTVGNKGNVSADVAMQVKLYNLFGDLVDEVGGEYPVIPDQSLTKHFVAQYRPLFGGWYQVEPSIRYSEKLGAYGTSSKDVEYETKVGTTEVLFIMPRLAGLAIIIGSVLIVAGALYVIIHRVRRTRIIQSNLKTHWVEEGDTLQSIAIAAGVSWKDIARINKLPAPYSLKTGDALKVPIHRSNKKTKSKK